jgi:hypothetical protein
MVQQKQLFHNVENGMKINGIFLNIIRKTLSNRDERWEKLPVDKLVG